jgi:molybdopterin molybdotransferase
MITVEEAREKVTKEVQPIGSVSLKLEEASGRILAEDIVASVTLPPFDNSAMDGYAVRAEDILTGDLPAGQAGRTLQVIGEVQAGEITETVVQPGQAIRIMTGAPIPEGADAVVPQEMVESNGNQVKVLKEVQVGDHIRPAGEDVMPGTLLMKKGRKINPADIGVLASLGFENIKVSEKPTVAILATGDELLEIGDPLEPGKIRNSNMYALSSLFRSYGANPLNLGIARDKKEDLEEKLLPITNNQLPVTDILVTIGGVSVGDYDFVQEVLKNLGMEVLFWKVAVKPGKPLLFGKINHRRDAEDAEIDLDKVSKTLVFGLPGNPVSTMVTSELFIKPALLKMMGRKDWKPSFVKSILRGKGLKQKEGREVYVTSITEYQDGRFVSTPTSAQGSGLLTSISNANSLIKMGMDVKGFEVGDEVEVLLLNREWRKENRE